MKRPEELTGKTIKIRVGCGSMFITINYSNNQPVEMFINGSKIGGCRSNQEAISRLVTLCLREGISVDLIIDQLEMIRCVSCSHQKAKLSKDEVVNFPTSCGDAVAKVLKANKIL